MPVKKLVSFPIIQPNLQISFYFRLQIVRDLYLQDALKKTVTKLDIKKIDNELANYVSPDKLRHVASFGLRGEVFFPVPCMLKENPFLLGYYRLLFGLSQKEFYNKGPFGRFKRLEDRGDFTKLQKPLISALCKSLVKTAEALVEGIDEISTQTIHELQLLTLGPQLRGGANTRIGQDATQDIFWTIIRVDVDSETIKRESPTTTHFFHIDRIANRSTKEHALFRDLLSSLVGIRA